MTLKSYAKILGVSPNEKGLIFKKDIRIAYLQLAKHLHPDKTKTDASKQFIDLKEAYDKLMDACKDEEFTYIGGETDFEFEKLVNLIKDILSKLKKHINIHKQSTTPNPPPLTDIKLQVTIQELYTGIWKKIKYKYLAVGGQLLSDEVIICLENYQDEYIFPQKGDDVNGNRVDLRVTLEIMADDMFYVDTVLTRYDICMTSDISLYDYYYREFFEIDYFGEIIKVEYSPGLSLQTVPGKGLPFLKDGEQARGDLVLFFKLVLPQSIPETLKPIMEQHFARI
jgi:DnaJ-class molecular chaperone